MVNKIRVSRRLLTISISKDEIEILKIKEKVSRLCEISRRRHLGGRSSQGVLITDTEGTTSC